MCCLVWPFIAALITDLLIIFISAPAVGMLCHWASALPALSSPVEPTRSVQLAYGRGSLGVDLPENRTDIIEPVSVPGLKDEKESFLQSINHPIESRPLREYLRPDARVCVVFTDITRA